MKIDFVRTGGVAGLRLTLALDTESLPAEEGSRIRRLVEAADFFELEPGRSVSSAAPDRFEYRVAIQSQVWGQNAVVVAESDVPDELRPLLEQLTALAMRRDKPDQAAGRGSPPTS